MSTFVPSLLDLQTSKADDSAVVHNTGTETVNGVKTFTSTIQGNISGTAGGGAPPSGTAGGDLSGSFPNPTVAKINGVTLGSTIATSGNLLIASGSQWVTNAMSGDATISSSGALTLGTVNSNVGTVGDGTHVSQITVNAKGLITAASSVAITGAAPTGAAGGSLTGTYPNPTIANLAVTNAMIANSTIDLTAKVTGILPNANTTATDANTASTIVARDASGNFSAGTITATLSGTATNATNIAITDDTTTSAVFYPVIVSANTGNLPAKVTSTHFLINPSTGRASVTALTVSAGTASSSPTTGTLILSGGLGINSNLVMGKNGSIATSDFFIMGDLSQASGGKYWGMQPSGTTLSAYTLTDAFASPTNWLQVTRSGASITTVAFPNGSVNIAGLTASNIVMTDASKNLISLAILTSVNGGTGNGFTKFSGAATTEKTYTLPNASTTILTTNAAVTAAQGGTGVDSSAWAQGDLVYISATGTWNHLAKDTNSTRYLSNTGTTNNPAWAQVDLTNGVTGRLPFANLTQGSALSVLGVTGNATADNASIAAGSDNQVLRRSGTAVAFGAVNLASSNAVTGTLPNANTTAVSTNTASTIALRDSNGAFSMGALTSFGSGISTNGTAATILVNGAGSTTVAGSTANFSSGNSSTAGNIYGISVEKFGTEVLYMGVNKNTATDSVPANACFLTTYSSTGKLCIGRGAANSLPSTADILLNGDGSVTFAGSIGIGVTPINGTLTFNNATASPFPRCVLYSVANNDHQYLGYGISSNTLRYQVPDSNTDHVFFAASSSSASTELLRVKGNTDVQATSGNIIINTAGKTLKVKQGTNACAGTGAVMVGGTVTVSTNAVATGDIILTCRTATGGTPGLSSPVVTISNGVSFTLTSSNVLDTSTYSWVIIKAA